MASKNKRKGEINLPILTLFISCILTNLFLRNHDLWKRRKIYYCATVLMYVLFFCGVEAQRGPLPHFWDFWITHNDAVGRTPLDEWSASRRALYLTTHNTHNRQTSMPPVGFEPTISAGKRPYTGTGFKLKLNSVALVRERTIPTERPPPVGEVSANFCG